jgi:carboxymethylenebutenolidase
MVSELKAPVLGLYAGRDQGIPQDEVEEMRTKMKAAGKKGEIVVYPDADHGFNADYRPSYNKAAARDAWKRMLAFFKANGAA